MQINIQNNQENLYEKIKKMMNNPFVKFSLGFVGLGTIGIAAKLIYDKIHQNKIDKVYNELVIDNDVTLSTADQIWISKNMILFAQKYPLCWHNVFMQLLACPEYIHYSNDPNHPIHKSKKIMTMIDFAKKNLPGIFSEGKVKVPKVKVPMEVRQMPDDVILKIDQISGEFVPEDDSLSDEQKEYIIDFANFDNVNDVIKNNEGKYIFNLLPNKIWLTDKEKYPFVLHPRNIYDQFYRFDDVQFNQLEILDVPVTEFYKTGEKEYGEGWFRDICKPINELDSPQLAVKKRKKIYGWYAQYKKDDVMKYYTRRAENIFNEYNRGNFSFKDINCCQEYGYYPTFVVIYDNVDYSSIPHYHCCYIVYDKDKNIKYFLWGDGIKNSFSVMSAGESLERLNKYSSIWVKYSRSDIVEKFYTPFDDKNCIAKNK